MIGYFFKQKIFYFFRKLKNIWQILFTLLFTSLAVFYGFVFGQINNDVYAAKVENLTYDDFQKYLFLGIAVFTLMRMIIPSYIPMKRIVPNYYPLQTIEKYFISLIDDIYRPFFFYLLVFIGSLYFNLAGEKTTFLIGAIITLFSAHLIRRSIQYSIDFKLKKQGYLVLPLLAGIAYYMFTFYTFPPILLWVVLIISLTLAGYYQEKCVVEQRIREISSKKKTYSIYIKLIINNKYARLPLIMGIVLT